METTNSPSPRRRRSLSARLVMLVALPLVAAVTGIVAVVTHLYVGEIAASERSQTEAVVEAFQGEFLQIVLLGETEAGVDLSSRMTSFPRIRRIDVVDQRGAIAFAFRARGTDTAPMPMSGSQPGGGVLAFARPLQADRNRVGTILVEVSMDDAAAARRSAAWLAAAVIAAVLAMAAGLAAVLRRSVTRPLTQLTRAASALGAGDLDTEIRLARSDELGELASTLDAMRRSLAASYTEIRNQNRELVELGRLRETAVGASVFRAFFEQSPHAIVAMDDRGIYVDANPAACALYGRPADQIVGRSVGDFHAPDGRESARGNFDRLLEAGDLHVRARVMRPGGEIRDVDVHARARVLPDRHIATLTDVTDARKQDETFRRIAAGGVGAHG